LALTPAEPRYDFDPTPSLLPVPDHPADTFTPKRTWYGWQTLTIDGASALIVITNLQDRRSQGYAWLGLAGYVLGPPIVHAAHDNWLSFAGSLGSRVLLPLAGGLIGIGANQCHGGSQDYCDVSGIATGILVGYAAAVTIDAVALAWTPKRKPDALAGNTRTLRVGPLIGHDRQGLSVSGTF
jgi:hypothetical protein